MQDALKPPQLPLITDGNLAHWLGRGVARHHHPPFKIASALNLDAPDIVMTAHQAFHSAGAQLLRTNTLGAERVTLARYGLEERTEAINNSGAALVQNVTGPAGFKMGVIGQILSGENGLDMDAAARERAYSEQIVYLSDTDVTFFLLEHFTHLSEAEMVLKIVLNASDAPLLAQLRMDDQGRTLDGEPIQSASRALIAQGAGAIGVTCSPWESTLKALEDLLTLGVPVSIMAGLHDSNTTAPFTNAPAWSPEEYAEHLGTLVGEGVHIVGGCCGVSPEHTRALVGWLHPES